MGSMKKILLLALLSSLVWTASGCMSSSELDTVAFASSIVYDQTEDGNISVTLEVMNPSAMGGGPEQGGGRGNPCLYLAGEGKTISDATKQISQAFERRLYYPHIKARFFTEKYARDRLESSMDYLLRYYQIRESAKMVVLKGAGPDELYQASTGLEDTVADYIEDMENTHPYMLASSVFVDAISFMRSYYLDGEEPVAGVAELMKEEKPIGEPAKTGGDSGGSSGQSETAQYKIRYAGLAVFRDAKLQGFLDDQETRVYNFVTNKLRTAVFSLPFGEEYSDVIVTGSHADIWADIGGDKPVIGIRIKSVLSIRGEQGAKDMDSEETLREISDKFNGTLKEEAENAIRKVQREYQSDIFGFGKIAHIQNPSRWKEIKGDWNNLFSNADVHVEVESTVKRTGEIRQSFRKED
jgi:spore germination protein KC